MIRPLEVKPNKNTGYGYVTRMDRPATLTCPTMSDVAYSRHGTNPVSSRLYESQNTEA